MLFFFFFYTKFFCIFFKKNLLGILYRMFFVGKIFYIFFLKKSNSPKRKVLLNTSCCWGKTIDKKNLASTDKKNFNPYYIFSYLLFSSPYCAPTAPPLPASTFVTFIFLIFCLKLLVFTHFHNNHYNKDTLLLLLGCHLSRILGCHFFSLLQFFVLKKI